MEGVPRAPMISVDMKICVGPQAEAIGEILLKFVRYQGDDVESFRGPVAEFQKLREAMMKVAPDLYGCTLLKKYYGQLLLMKNRFPMKPDGPCAIPFAWMDKFFDVPTPFSYEDVDFELVCVLHNIGAIHAILGSMDSRITADGMKVSCTHFQCAAWCFQQLRDEMNCENFSVDFDRNILSWYINLMLAQAQECILEKSLVDNRKHSIIAKVATQIVDFYGSCIRALEHQSIEEVFGSPKAEEEGQFGRRVTCMDLAANELDEALTIAKKATEFEPTLTFAADVIKGKQQISRKENDFIYHEKVESEAPEVKGASLVKPIPFDPFDPEICGVDLFAKFLPAEVHMSASVYSEEKAKLLRDVNEKVEAKDLELEKFVTTFGDSLELPEMTAELPPELIERCAALNAKESFLNDLDGKLTELQDSHEKVFSILGEITEVLKSMGSNKVIEEKFKSHIDTVSADHRKYTEADKQASSSNNELKKVWSEHRENLGILAMPIDKLKEKLPDMTKLEELAPVKNFAKVLSKLEEMRSQRKQLLNDLREGIKNDDINKRLVAEMDKDQESIYDRELKKHQEIVDYLSQNMSAQPNIVKAITEAHANLADVRQQLESRQNAIASLIGSFETAIDLDEKANRGMQFYEQLSELVKQLKTKGDDLKRGMDKMEADLKEKAEKAAALAAEKAVPKTTLPSPDVLAPTSLPQRSPAGGKKGVQDYMAFFRAKHGGGGTTIPQEPEIQMPQPTPVASTSYNPGYRPTPQTMPAQPPGQPSFSQSHGPSGPVPVAQPMGQGPGQGYHQPPQGPMHTTVPPAIPSASYQGQYAQSSVASQHQPAYIPPVSHGQAPLAQNPQHNHQFHPNATHHQVPPVSSSPLLYGQQQGGQYHQAQYAPAQPAMQNSGFQGPTISAYHGSIQQMPVSTAAPVNPAQSAGGAYGGYQMPQDQSQPQRVQQPHMYGYQYQPRPPQAGPSGSPQSYSQPGQPQYAPATQHSFAHSQNPQVSTYGPGQGPPQTQYAPSSIPMPQGQPPTTSSHYAKQAQPAYVQPQQVQQQSFAQPGHQQFGQNFAQAQPAQQQPGRELSPQVSTGQQHYDMRQLQPSATGQYHQAPRKPSGFLATAMAASKSVFEQFEPKPIQPAVQPAPSSPVVSQAQQPTQLQQTQAQPLPTSGPPASQSQGQSQHMPGYGGQHGTYQGHTPGGPVPYSNYPGPAPHPHSNVPVSQHQPIPPLPTPSPTLSSTGQPMTMGHPAVQPTQSVIQPTQPVIQSAPPGPHPTHTSAQSVAPTIKPATRASVLPAASGSATSLDVLLGPLHPESTNSTVLTNGTSATIPVKQSGSAINQTIPKSPPVLKPTTAPKARTVQKPKPVPAPVPPQTPATDGVSLPGDNDFTPAGLATGTSGMAGSIDWGSKAPATDMGQRNGRASDVPRVNQPIKRSGSHDPFVDDAVLQRFSTEVEKFDKQVRGLTKKSLNGPTSLEAKWRELSDRQDQIAKKHTISVGRCAAAKNRFPEIMPYDDSRVKLKNTRDDYINASYVKGISNDLPNLILTQAPMGSTVNDFWGMIFEEMVEVIICLVQDSELKPPYFPSRKSDPPFQTGEFVVSLNSRLDDSCFVQRILNIHHVKTKQARSLIHLQFTGWPVGSNPDSPKDLLRFIREAHKFYQQQRSSLRPVVIHCLSGASRSGVFTLVYTVMMEMLTTGTLPCAYNTLTDIRACRKYSVHDQSELLFAMEAILFFAQELLMKRGIITGKASFDEVTVTPSPKSHTRNSSRDLLFDSTLSFAAIQSMVSTKSRDSTPDSKGQNLSRKSSASSTGRSEPDRSRPNPVPMKPSILDTLGGPTNPPVQPPAPVQPSAPVANVKPLLNGTSHDESSLKPATDIDLTARNDDLSSTNCTKDTPASEIDTRISSLVTPDNFKVEPVDNSKRKTTKKDFVDPEAVSKSVISDDADPLATLDPLWSLRKKL